MRILKLLSILLVPLIAFSDPVPNESIQRSIGTNTVFGSSSRTPFQVNLAGDLQAVNVANVGNGQVASILGYTVLGDGGGGQFTYSPSSVAPDDGGISVLAPNSGSGRWLRISNLYLAPTAGTGLLFSSNQFSVNPTQSLTSLTVTDPISASLQGNADTASKLATARTINGVSFDGSGNVTVPAAAGTLTGSTIAAAVTASSLTSVGAGTIGTMAIQNSTSISATGGTLNGVTVTGLPAPSANSDAVRLIDLNSVSSGITQRTSVAVATTANITLSGEQTIDGVLTSASRILVKNQTLTQNNGIYVTAAGAWSRASDSNTAAQLKVGYYYFVSAGTTQGSTGWSIQTAPTTLGTDPIVFAQFSASSSYTNGAGLGLTGNVFSVNAAQPGVTSVGTLTGLTVSGHPTLEGVTSTGATGTGKLVFDNSPTLVTPNIGAASASSLSSSGQITSTVSTGTAPLVIASTTQVANLNAATAGSATNSTNATNTGITDDTTTNASYYPTWVTSNTGNLPQKVSSTKFTFNPSTGIANATGFTGAHNGSLGATTPSSAIVTTLASNSNANIRTTKGNFNITVVNVKDYGAVGNGSTADQAAINSAIAALTSNSTLYFPPGVYRITSGLTGLTGLSNVTITGDSAEIYNDSGSAGGNVWVFDPSCTGLNCYGITYAGTSTVRGNGIVFRCGASNTQIHDNIFLPGCASDFAIHITGPSGGWSNGVSVYGNIINGPLGDGIHVGNATNVLVANNNLSGTGDDSIAVVADDPAYPPNRVLVVGNLIYNSGGAASSVSGSGIRVAEGVDVQVSDNHIYSTWESGIHVTRYLSTSAYNTRVTISNNKLYNVTTHSGPRGAIWLEWCDQSNVINNQIIDTANGAGIAILDCSDLTVKNNFLRATPFRGIVFDDSTTTHVATSWTQIFITGNDLDWVKSNEAIYAVPASGITVTNLIITGNSAQIVGGNWIYYDRINTGRVFNNTNSSGATVASGGSVTSVTAGNNN